MKTKLFYICTSFILIVICAIFYFQKNSALKPTSIQQFKCPESYTEDDTGTEEYREALVDWTASFFEENPKATISDWSMAKLKLWEDNNCAMALERSKLSGEVADLRPWELEDYTVQMVWGALLDDIRDKK